MTASEICCDDFLNDVLVESQVGNQVLEPCILGFELPKLAKFADAQAGVLLLPHAKGRIREAQPATRVGNWRPRFRLPQYIRDPLLGEFGLLLRLSQSLCLASEATSLQFKTAQVTREDVTPYRTQGNPHVGHMAFASSPLHRIRPA